MLPAIAGHPAGHPLDAYDYYLPPQRIAQAPARRRVQARLMALDREGGAPRHHKVAHLTRLLKPGDLLVVNDTRVVPARIWLTKPSGGRVEMLLLSPARPVSSRDGWETHQVLLRCHRPLPVGGALMVEGAPHCRVQVLQRGERGAALVAMSAKALELSGQVGRTPLPPYVKRPSGPSPEDERRYQTVYAAQPGAVAAPTAGLHFSPELLAALGRRGVEVAGLTLHVGYGTFAEPRPEDLATGRLHPEWVQILPETVDALTRTKARGGRVLAVGTTSLRALEWRVDERGLPLVGQGWCDLLVTPGFEFRVADGLLTNFHLPRTTLLMLVAALVGRMRLLAAYAEAIEADYRFYSFGDAMLIT